jgi:Fe2+ transport system protein FeoA
MKPICLCDLAVGATARFHEARLDPEACHLLGTLGLTKSSLVRLCKRGEPCIVQVRATRIGLSRAVAGSIFVLPERHDGPDGHDGHEGREGF